MGRVPLARGVVEVDVHVKAVGLPVGDDVGPVVELGVRVAAAVRLAGSVKADVGTPGCYYAIYGREF